MLGYVWLKALMYCCATWVVGDQPHQVMLAEVAEPALPVDEPLAQAARNSTRKLRIEIAGITRRLRLSLTFGDLRIVPPGPVLAAEGAAVAERSEERRV